MMKTTKAVKEILNLIKDDLELTEEQVDTISEVVGYSLCRRLAKHYAEELAEYKRKEQNKWV